MRSTILERAWPEDNYVASKFLVLLEKCPERLSFCSVFRWVLEHEALGGLPKDIPKTWSIVEDRKNPLDANRTGSAVVATLRGGLLDVHQWTAFGSNDDEFYLL